MAIPDPSKATLPHPINPFVGYLGSSNLTFAGLSSRAN